MDDVKVRMVAETLLHELKSERKVFDAIAEAYTNLIGVCLGYGVKDFPFRFQFVQESFRHHADFDVVHFDVASNQKPLNRWNETWVSLSVGPNLQQVFSGSSSVYLSCDDDGQTADGWTVKRTRGGLTEDCGAAPGFGRLLGSYCVVDLSAPSETFWCEDSSGQQSDRVSFSVQSDTKDEGVILEIPALPVRTGSDVILRCRQRNGATVKAYFFIKGSSVGLKPKLIITNITQADEGLYSCSTDESGKSPQSSLRVRASTCPPPPPPPSLLVPVVAGLVSGLLLVLVLGGVLFLCSKLKGGRGADLWSCGGDGCLRRSVCLCFSGLFLLTAAGELMFLHLSVLIMTSDLW
ncbi:uncharacterized protein LOC109201628 [Oreochromis niloticus]|uniref:uncharacterized protein LOC109201628 n=1 Tax=Oreochromis niloticus TaxID=8128 RepID=UPI000DF4A927|nr:uncharacterized protein LOC109201628 [Oreochromis niloticus]